MKKTYIFLSVFCCILFLFCGCKKTSYFESKEEIKEETKDETITEEIDAENKVSDTQEVEPTPTNVYVYIYPKEGYESVITSEPIDVAEYAGKINLNTASASDLMTLPGIGEAKAEAILAYRSEHGGFYKVEDLMNIPGIKEGVYSKIKEQIYVN